MPVYSTNRWFFDVASAKPFHELMIEHVGFSKNPPSSKTNHDHRSYNILHYVESGKGTFHCAGRSYALQSGDLYLFPKDIDVGYEADANDPWAVYYVAFYGDIVDYFLTLTGLSKDDIALHDISNTEIPSMFYKLVKEGGKQFPSLSLLIGYLYEMFGYLFKHVNAKEDTAVSTDIFSVMISYIDTRLSTSLRLNDLSVIFHLSQSQIYRIFMDRLDISPKQYIQEAKIKYACSRITSTDLPLKTIAAECGFEYESHFNKTFRKIKGMSPSEYRQQKH